MCLFMTDWYIAREIARARPMIQILNTFLLILLLFDFSLILH
jgi:hypothetical protein